MERNTHKWRHVKAKIIIRYGSVAECARKLKCSNEAIRQTVTGRCPGIAAKLEAVLQ